MEGHRHLPDADRLSVLEAIILLAYALTRFVNIPEHTLTLPFPGILLEFTFNFQTIVFIIVAGLAAAGTDWLLRDHPRLSARSTYQHWLLPSMTALVIVVPLSTLANGPEWWIVFTMGGVLLALVFIAEYIVVDASDDRFPMATSGLTALSFALFLILAIAMHAAGFRLYLMVPVLATAAALTSLRTLYLLFDETWLWGWALAIGLLIGQFAAGLHYWKITSIPFGLALVAPVYALTRVAQAIEEGKPFPKWAIEPAIMLFLIWGLAVFVV